MNWVYVILACCLFVAEVALVYELHEARKEMKAIRNDVPKWVGASIAFSVLVAAVKKRSE